MQRLQLLCHVRVIRGRRGCLEGVASEAISDYWARTVRGGRLVATISGGFEPEAVRQALQPLEAIAAGAPQATTPSAWQGPGHLNGESAPVTGRLVWLMPGPTHTATDLATARLADHLTGGGLTSRLVSALRTEQGLAYAVQSRLESYSDTGLWWIEVETDPSLVPTCQATLLTTMDKLASEGPAAWEVADAQAHDEALHYLAKDDLHADLEKDALGRLYGYPPSVTDNALTAEDNGLHA